MAIHKDGESVVRRCHRFYGNGLPLTFLVRKWFMVRKQKSQWQTISIEPMAIHNRPLFIPGLNYNFLG